MADPMSSGTSVGEALDEQRRKLVAAIAELPPDVLLVRDLADLEAELVERYRIDPLVLDWGAKTVERGEVAIEVDAADDAHRRISGPPKPATVTGTAITVFIPYSGARGLFGMRPMLHTADPPRGFVREHDLLLRCSGVDLDPAAVRREIARAEAAVKKWVFRVNREVVAFDVDLPGEVHAALQPRIHKVRADADLMAGLGIPEHQRPPRRHEDLGPSGTESTAGASHESVPGPRRGPGRPGWTPELFEERWREAWAATPEPRTFQALAANFRALDGTLGGVSGDHLRKLRCKRFPE
jgi:hypothetical protein